MAYELDDPFAALVSSSARHSAMDLMLRNDASLAPVVRRAMACEEKENENKELKNKDTTTHSALRLRSLECKQDDFVKEREKEKNK